MPRCSVGVLGLQEPERSDEWWWMRVERSTIYPGREGGCPAGATGEGGRRPGGTRQPLQLLTRYHRLAGSSDVMTHRHHSTALLVAAPARVSPYDIYTFHSCIPVLSDANEKDRD